ncbi:hypothetical protein O7606_12010 [Micromonospora sp. WMMD882]|uniref:hypothetical protein n=1 Tax=Micromonospora sp. WMMD882 TaxID=3015151 RepID=UPI00248CEF40|nr:hypothetical protein [Micromonospora sp. WMMD882]WBB82017.1 hypothetical protein O7606_12010 [Micromonospora sp. WMMD882]
MNGAHGSGTTGPVGGASDVVDCPECVTVGCPRCHWRGRRRAQLLLTVANRETGAVASARVTPADLDPRPDPAGGWAADLTHRVRDLAATVAVPLDPEPLAVRLPPQWRPDLPERDRHALAAAALAELARRRPWRLWLGGSTVPPPEDPADRLGRLCDLAGLLLLDLVVTVRRHDDQCQDDRCQGDCRRDDCRQGDRRQGDCRQDGRRQGERWRWTVRYEVPGSPARHVPAEGSPDLATALAETDARAALTGLTARGRHAPPSVIRADLSRAASPSRPLPVPGGPATAVPRVDRLAGRLLAALGDRVAAQARWRDDAWRIAPLDHPDPTTTEPSATVLVTITDLRRRVAHVAWTAGAPEEVCEVATGPGGRPVVQLPQRYRLGAWAHAFGVPPEELAEADGGHGIPRELRDGYVTLPSADADPVGEYVRAVGRGLPGGRLIVTAVRPDVPPLAELARLVTGLDLALQVSLLDLGRHAGHPSRADGRYWSVQVRPRDAPVDPADLPTRPSLAAALDDCVTHLADDLSALVPADPEAPLPAPCAPPRASLPDPASALLRLAAEHAGRAVTLRLTRAGDLVYRHHEDGVCRLPPPVGSDGSRTINY